VKSGGKVEYNPNIIVERVNPEIPNKNP